MGLLSCGMWTLPPNDLPYSGKFAYSTNLASCFIFMVNSHIEGVWAVDMDALRLASASHGVSLGSQSGPDKTDGEM